MLPAIGAANATFRSLHDAWAGTATPHGRLILTVPGGPPAFERHLIAARTSVGQRRARANRVLFGWPRKLTPHQARGALKRLDAGVRGRPLHDLAAQGAARGRV